MGNKEQLDELSKLNRQIALLEEEKSDLIDRVKTLSLQGREKTTLIKNLFDYLPNGVVMFDNKRQVIQANQAAANIFSIEKRQLIGKNCTELFHCYEKNGLCPVLDQHQPVNKMRTQCLSNDSMLLRSAVLNSDKDNTVVVESLVDITELVKARVEKTLALQTKSNFLANISHELRTPMHGILGCSNLLSEKTDELPGKFKAYLQTLESSSNRLWELIEKLFEASNLEEDSVKLQLKEIRLKHFFTELEEEFHLRFDDYKNQFEFIHHNLECRVVTDAMHLHQIIFSLLENASKFTEKGYICCESRIIGDGSDSVLHIEVKDDGIGISAEKQQQIFNLFEQEDGSSERSYQGAGLGLTISRQLAILMGGDIEVRSEPGVGSTFTLKVPVEVRK